MHRKPRAPIHPGKDAAQDRSTRPITFFRAFVAVDEDQEIVGVGASPDEALAFARWRADQGTCAVHPASAGLAAQVRAGQMTCWLLDDDGVACSEDELIS